jgi:hypothetical protein
MIRTLTVAPYKMFGGQGNKARGIVKCISDHKDIQNYSIPIFSENVEFDLELDKESEDYDLCIQNVDFKNFVKTPYVDVGIFEPAFKKIRYIDNYVRLLDYAIVFGEKQKECLGKKVSDKVRVARPTIMPMERPSKQKAAFSKFTFYTSTFEEYTNLDLVLLSYLTSFSINDKVNLTILSPDPNSMVEYIASIKSDIGRFGTIDMYPEITLRAECNSFSEFQCLIDASMGYDLSINTMLSVASGNPVIASSSNAICEWVNDGIYKFESNEGSRNSFLIGDVPISSSLSEKMLSAFHESKKFQEMQAALIEDSYKSFYPDNEQTVGEILCSLL